MIETEVLNLNIVNPAIAIYADVTNLYLIVDYRISAGRWFYSDLMG